MPLSNTKQQVSSCFIAKMVRSTGVRLLARNIKAMVLRQQPLITGEGVFKDLDSHHQSIELSNSLRSPRRMEGQNIYAERVRDPLNLVNSGQNSYAEAVREQPNFMNPRLNTVVMYYTPGHFCKKVLLDV